MSGLRFENKVAIVTGGCSGIGKGCAELLAENGGTVVVFDIQDKLGDQLRCDGTEQIIYMRCDMFKEDQIKKCVVDVVARCRKLDCIVNNVGIQNGPTCIETETLDDFRRLLEINLISHYAMYKHCLPHIRKTKWSVVNIGSSCGTIGHGVIPTYSATKGAIIALSKSLAVAEAKNGVRINCICPGCIDTPMMSALLKDCEDPVGFEDIMKRMAVG